MKRSKHSLSYYKLITCDMGELVPVGLTECLPGDTFQHSTSLLLRLSPLMAPVMHSVQVRVHHWFVPNRLVYAGWEDFITGGKDGTGSTIPYPINNVPWTANEGEILDYMGIPTGIAFPAGKLGVMPVQAYNKIYNEFYRDEDLCPERDQYDVTLAQVAWEKDYFTTARPWSQKGPAVTMPIGDTAPLVFSPGGNPKFKTISEPTGAELYHTAGVGVDHGAGTSPGEQLTWDDPKLTGYADLSNATSADIIDIRRAFALQRYQEARAQYGSRYVEYLRYLGINPADARLQRPEYLGGGKQNVSFSEVLRTGNESATSTAPIGEMLGHGIAAMRSNRYRYFCQEHGYIITMLSLRPKTIYQDGISKTWSRRTKEDYFQKELELIGQQEIYNRELYANGTSADDQVFGYQDRYSDYRHAYSGVSSEFRNILSHWHMARQFASLPVLNQSFVECDPAKRIFAEQNQNSCWIMVQHKINARRLVSHNTIGRVL